MPLELFEKTEIWVTSIHIADVNLESIAEKFAEVLNLKKQEIMVVDVREGLITLDVLKKTVNAEDIIGKKNALLNALETVPGIALTAETSIHSDGILGLIDIDDQKQTDLILGQMERMRCEISDRIQKRVIVFPSGFEIRKGMIRDTNSPYIRDRLAQEGYNVTVGEILEDELENVLPILRGALGDGYGLIVSTGGVGAEGKDCMVEALLKLDPEAATPYIVHYRKGTGRHEKDGVRIGVAYLHPTYLVALPGPHEEAKVGIEIVVEGLKKRQDKRELALALSKEYIKRLKHIRHSS